MAAPKIQTYHCHCTTLLFTTTHTLSLLPRRASPSVDNSIILPLNNPPPPSQDIEDDEEAEGIDSDNAPDKMDTDDPKDLPELGYTVLLSLSPDRRPTIIRREDGFEKRVLYRCDRCLLVVGYVLDESHYSAEDDSARTKVLYVLPGGVMSTELMANGKKATENEVLLGPGPKAVAAWE